MQCQPLPTLGFLRQRSSEKSPQINSFDKDTVPIVQLITMTEIVTMKDGCIIRKQPAEPDRELHPTPKFSVSAQTFQMSLIYAFIGCPSSVILFNSIKKIQPITTELYYELLQPCIAVMMGFKVLKSDTIFACLAVLIRITL